MYTKVLKILDKGKGSKNGNESSGENEKRFLGRDVMMGSTIFILSSKKSSFKVHLKAVSLSKSSLSKVFINIKKEEMCIFFAFFFE